MLVNKEKRVRSVESRSGDWLDEYPKKKIVCYIMEWGRRDDDLILLYVVWTILEFIAYTQCDTIVETSGVESKGIIDTYKTNVWTPV